MKIEIFSPTTFSGRSFLVQHLLHIQDTLLVMFHLPKLPHFLLYYRRDNEVGMDKNSEVLPVASDIVELFTVLRFRLARFGMRR